MGSPLGSMLANIFVGYYELKVLTNAAIVQPTLYFRYVDDVCSSAKKIVKISWMNYLNCILNSNLLVRKRTTDLCRS